MNKTAILAKEKFNGDMRQTIKYIMTNFDSEKMEEYAKEFDSEQSTIFMEFLMSDINKYVSREKISEVINDEMSLVHMEMTRDEVNSMEVNPFKAKIGYDFLKLLILNGGLAATYLVINSFGGNVLSGNFAQIVSSVSAIFTGFLSISTTKDILNYFKFKKLKDKFNSEDYKNVNDIEQSNGRSM